MSPRSSPTSNSESYRPVLPSRLRNVLRLRLTGGMHLQSCPDVNDINPMVINLMGLAAGRWRRVFAIHARGVLPPLPLPLPLPPPVCTSILKRALLVHADYS